jgi:L-amino acid N-acyltransferase YncA
LRTVGTRQRIGRMSHGPMAGQWRDTILLERRSDKV